MGDSQHGLPRRRAVQRIELVIDRQPVMHIGRVMRQMTEQLRRIGGASHPEFTIVIGIAYATTDRQTDVFAAIVRG